MNDVDMLGGGDDLDLSKELFHGRLKRSDRLACHDDACAFVPNGVDSTPCAFANSGNFIECVISPFIKLFDGAPEALHGDGHGTIGRDGQCGFNGSITGSI